MRHSADSADVQRHSATEEGSGVLEKKGHRVIIEGFLNVDLNTIFNLLFCRHAKILIYFL